MKRPHIGPIVADWPRQGKSLDSAADGAYVVAFMSAALRELTRRIRQSEPCLPRPAKIPPSGPDWIHEIKHDGFRIMARRHNRGVRLITRNGYDFADRFPLAAAAIAKLPVRPCLIDGHRL